MNGTCWKRLLLAATLLSVSTLGARAGGVTGDPSADGWDLNGNSLDKGTYVYSNWPIDSNPNRYPIDNKYLFDYKVYSTSFNLATGSALIDGNGWQAGDLVLGIGATGLSSAALDGQVRFLAKFGADGSTYAASSFAPANPIPTSRSPGDGWTLNSSSQYALYGDGVGTSAAAGTGGIIVETPQIWSGQNPFFNATNAGTIISIDGTSATNNNDPGAGTLRQARVSSNETGGYINSLNVAKIVYNLDGTTGYLSNFETYLNVSLLEREGNNVNYLIHPEPGDKFVLAVQRLDNYFTKATGEFGAVPEPSSLVLAALGLGGLGLSVLRRSRASA